MGPSQVGLQGSAPRSARPAPLDESSRSALCAVLIGVRPSHPAPGGSGLRGSTPQHTRAPGGPGPSRPPRVCTTFGQYSSSLGSATIGLTRSPERELTVGAVRRTDWSPSSLGSATIGLTRSPERELTVGAVRRTDWSPSSLGSATIGLTRSPGRELTVGAVRRTDWSPSSRRPAALRRVRHSGHYPGRRRRVGSLGACRHCGIGGCPPAPDARATTQACADAQDRWERAVTTATSHCVTRSARAARGRHVCISSWRAELPGQGPTTPHQRHSVRDRAVYRRRCAQAAHIVHLSQPRRPAGAMPSTQVQPGPGPACRCRVGPS